MNRRDFMTLGGATLGALLLLPASEALARAGGGSSGGGSRSSSFGGFRSSSSRSSSSRSSGPPLTPEQQAKSFGIFLVIAFVMFGVPLLALFALGFVVTKLFKPVTGKVLMTPQQAHAENMDLLSRLGTRDEAWRPEAMRQRVEVVFYKVQQAWTERNQDLAKDCMSPRLYAKHKHQTDEMLAQGRRNVLEQIQFLDCDILHVADRKGTRDDEFWAVVTGSMIDFEVLDGESEHDKRTWSRPFSEVWKFTREEHGWVLDKIEQDYVGASFEARTFSEELTA